MATRAQEGADGYSLSGSVWITNSPIADVFVVWAKDDSGQIRASCWRRAEGLERPGDPTARWGCAPASPPGEMVMDKCSAGGQPFPEVRGLKGPFTCEQCRYGIAWGALGQRRIATPGAASAVLDRKRFGRPRAKMNQLLQKKLADMLSGITLGLQGCHLGRT